MEPRKKSSDKLLLNKRRSSDLKKTIPTVPRTSKVIPKPKVPTKTPVKNTDSKSKTEEEKTVQASECVC